MQIPSLAHDVFDCARIARTAHEQYVDALNKYQQWVQQIEKCKNRIATARAFTGSLPFELE